MGGTLLVFSGASAPSDPPSPSSHTHAYAHTHMLAHARSYIYVAQLAFPGHSNQQQAQPGDDFQCSLHAGGGVLFIALPHGRISISR